MNILFTCGGTAGHVNPAVALARIFQERNPDCKVLFVGADGGMENHLVPKEGYEIRSVTITNFHRSLRAGGYRPQPGHGAEHGPIQAAGRPASWTNFSRIWWWAPGATPPTP